jgi:hypothetical protein
MNVAKPEQTFAPGRTWSGVGAFPGEAQRGPFGASDLPSGK